MMAGNPTAKELKALLARSALPQRNGNLVSYNPAAQGRRVGDDLKQAKKAATATPFEQLMATPIGGGKPPVHKQSIMGTLLNNPIGKGITTALGGLDMPRSVAISGVKELGDLGDAAAQKFGLPTMRGDDSDASFSEFLKQGQDHIGFGDIWREEAPGIAGKNKWVDRAVGLTGDIAYDPLTYLTLGAGKFAGVAGRVAAAEKVALATKAGVKGLDAAKIGRLGVNAANEAERKVIFAGIKNADELAQPGLRFAGQRIGGTAGFAEKVGGGLSKTRARIGDTAAGQKLRSVRAPEGLEAAYKTIASGKGNTNDALAMIARGRSEAMAKGVLEHKFAASADRLAHDIHKGGNGEEAFRVLDETLEPGVGRDFFDDVLAEGQKHVPTFERREGFAPHIWTKEARKALKGEEWTDLRKTIGMDVTAATGGVVKRSIHPGSKLTLPDGSVVEFIADTAAGAVSARQINEKIGGVLGGIKVIEDDLSKVLKPYIEGIAESVGRAEGLRALKKIADTAPLEDVIDNVATKAAGAKQARSIGKTLRTEADDTAKVVRELQTSGAKAQKATVSQLNKDLKAVTDELPAAKLVEKQADNARKGLAAERNTVTKATSERVSAAQQQLDKIAGEQTQLHKASVEGEPVAHIQKDMDARRAKALGSMSDAEKAAVKSYDDIDAAREAAGHAKFDAQYDQEAAKRGIANAQARLRAAEKINPSPSKGTAAAYAKVHGDLARAASGTAPTVEMRTVHSLLKTHALALAELRDGTAMNQALVQMQKAALKGEITPVVKQMVRDGYEQLGASLLGAEAPIVRKELVKQLNALETAINDPGFWKVVDKYTQFFKTYATATVGFHVRNGLTAGFMNAGDGVSVKNMSRGFSLWGKFDNNPRGFYDNLPEWINAEQAEDAVRAVFASGGGGGQYGRSELVLGRSRWTNNLYTRFSQRIGGKVEGFARMGMALDTILAGGTWEEAAARITRIHFDYSQVSKFDKTMKRIIPFWTFMSRNVPMQIQQMFLKPRMYQAYGHLSRNMGQDYEEGMIPLSWQEAGAFKLTDGVYLAPDLSHLRLKSDLEKITSDPQRLLADANPLFKVPFETLIGKRKLFSDTPFKEGEVESVSGSGLPSFLTPVLRALGAVDTAADGTVVIDSKVAYAIRGMLPPAGQSQRLTGDDPYYSDKRLQSVANWLGVPVKTLTAGQKAAEQARRERKASQASAESPKMKALRAYSNG